MGVDELCSGPHRHLERQAARGWALWFYPIIGAAIAAGQRRGRQWLIGRSEMSRRAMTVLMALLCLLSALNAIALVFNISLPSRAAVGGMSYEDLMRDQDFTRAVKSIAQECRVNVDIAKLMC